MLDELYRGQARRRRRRDVNEWSPAWDDTRGHRQSVRPGDQPNCTPVTPAMQTARAGHVAIYNLFDTPALLDAGLSRSLQLVHDADSRPGHFWEPRRDDVMGGEYDSAGRRAALAAGHGREQCRTSRRVRPVTWPDRRALAATRTAVVLQPRDRCVRPNLGAPRKPGDPNGVCKTDGSRSCPTPDLPGGGRVPRRSAQAYDGVCGA